uniref:Putative secreted protein n=1 Tax=Ixodes ricinus TaxID=34613 RepID=A0A6B0UJE3_IXORI
MMVVMVMMVVVVMVAQRHLSRRRHGQRLPRVAHHRRGGPRRRRGWRQGNPAPRCGPTHGGRGSTHSGRGNSGGRLWGGRSFPLQQLALAHLLEQHQLHLLVAEFLAQATH